MVEELQLEQSFDKAFGRAEELNAVFEKSEKPRQRIIVEILRRHNLPALVGPFFDVYFRITAGGGDIEKLTILMIDEAFCVSWRGRNQSWRKDIKRRLRIILNL